MDLGSRISSLRAKNHNPQTSASNGLDEPQYFSLLRLPLQLGFLKYRRSVHDDLEAPATRRDQLDLRVRIRLANLGGQTGRPGLVASNGAVFDRDVHVGSGSVVICKIAIRCATNRCREAQSVNQNPWTTNRTQLCAAAPRS